jgi:hypothetical protein
MRTQVRRVERRFGRMSVQSLAEVWCDRREPRRRGVGNHFLLNLPVLAKSYLPTGIADLLDFA